MGSVSLSKNSIHFITSPTLKFLLFTLFLVSCKTVSKVNYSIPAETTLKTKIKTEKFLTGADNVSSYFTLLENKKVGIVTNQTGLITYDSIYKDGMYKEGLASKTVHIVDYLVNKTDVELVKIYAPEHGFRGTAANGELITDGKDTKTGLPILSLYGNSKKPSPQQLAGIDVLMFDLQDVGARFYTYISHLHYIMEACAEQKIPLIILDRPNPNGGIVDGPILEKEHSSFIGMHTIPVLHGMTIGEYALMINGEGWLANGVQCELKIVPCENYKREMPYSLPVKPSPNLPNDQSINLYASLCFFEGTNVSIGRGTDMQFQVYGSPYLPNTGFSFKPEPNIGSTSPPNNGMNCYGEDLRNVEKVTQLELKWLIRAYQETLDKTRFFTSFFTKLAGNKTLQFQIQAGMPEDQIRESWVLGLEEFRIMRRKYLIY